MFYSLQAISIVNLIDFTEKSKESLSYNLRRCIEMEPVFGLFEHENA